jgi:predicted nucleic acid-binding protein
MPNVVSNTGPLIALASINQFNLLQQLFGALIIPPTVRAEVLDQRTQTTLQATDWITIKSPGDELAVQLLRESLQAGESEAIVLAKEISADWLLLDDLGARRRERAIGLRVVGTLGLLLMAKSAGYIPAIKPLIDQLRSTNFHADPTLYEQVLSEANEAE